MPIKIVRSAFEGTGREGDFSWMIQQPHYADALFIFNDNEAQFYEHQLAVGIPHSCREGGGNAAIRAYQCVDPQRATGIPTGKRDGYQDLSQSVVRAIDDALQVVESLLTTGRYGTVIYSWNESEQTLGTGIFRVAKEVLDYIVAGIDAAVDRASAT